MLFWCDTTKRWVGLLASELPEIFNWANFLIVESSARFVKEFVSKDQQQKFINPLFFFIDHNIRFESKQSLDVGFTKSTNIEHIDVQNALNDDCIYPVVFL